MQDNVELARHLYAAFADHDPSAIVKLLHPEFEGLVSAGMPLGVGGRHRGPERMLGDVWIPVFSAYDVRVEAEELLDCGEVVVAVGAYRGAERASGERFDACFAHLLRFRDGLIVALRQITDTATWPR